MAFSFPPLTYSTLTRVIKSYLYKQFDDDEDLQAFVDAFNGMAQERVTWIATALLPVYANNSVVVGSLLDWIGWGLYNYPRPVLPSGTNREVGPLNTYTPNQLPLNEFDIIGSQDVYVTTDDIYKRCLTWMLYKGDGKVFTIKWLKRRIMRFLTGANGGLGQTDDTSIVSVNFSSNNQVDIRIGPGVRTLTGGALPNRFTPNQFAPNEITSTFAPGPVVPYADILKSAIDAGVLELPPQFTYIVTIG